MATSSDSLLSLSTTIKLYENWFHYGLFVYEPLTTSVRNVLHNIYNDPSYHGLPVNPVDLYNELYNHHKDTLKRLLNSQQMMLLFPGSRRTCSENLQIPVLVVLIRNCTNLYPPTNMYPPVCGWDDVDPLDQSKAANVIRARLLADFFHYVDPKNFDKYTFDAKWREGDAVVTALGYGYDSHALKHASLAQTTLS